MSSRQIRKLQQQKELGRAKLQQQAEEEGSSEEEDTYQPPPKASAFAAFAALNDGNDDDEDEDEEEGGVEVKPVITKPVKEQSEDEKPAVAPAKKSKKPKKKKKKAAKTKTPEEKDEDSEDIDALLAELNIKDKESNAARQDSLPKTDAGYDRICKLVSINNNHLKVANEMRNLFGRVAVQPDAPQPRQRDEDFHMDLETALRGRHKPGKGMPELSLKRNIFIQGKDEWPRGTTGGLTMEVCNDIPRRSDDTVVFRFVHSQAYENVQNQFRHFVEMGDPQNLVGLLIKEPYNISLLLQVSKVAKNQGDHSLYNDLLERALFTLGRAATSTFGNKLKEGKARMDFDRPENREFWLAGFHYIQSLIMKGTYRTAFEWARLLFSLDPEEDPYSMHLMLHQLAYRSGEYEWLQTYGQSIFAGSEDARDRSPFLCATVALAFLSDKKGKEARDYLRASMEQIPYYYASLIKELGIDVPGPFWGESPQPGGEEFLCEIFIQQTKDLWNTPEANSLLMEMAHKVTPNDEVHYDDHAISLSDARYVYLQGNPSLMRLVPSKLMHRSPNSDSDPLPPDEEDNKFSWPSQRLPWERARNEGAGRGMFGDHFNPLAALQRLIPGFTGEGGERDEEALQAIGLEQEMRRRIRELESRREEAGLPPAGERAEDPALDGEEAVIGGADDPEASHLRRLYGYLFGAREPVPNGGAQPESDIDEEELRRVADHADYGSNGPPSEYSDDEEPASPEAAERARGIFARMFAPRELEHQQTASAAPNPRQATVEDASDDEDGNESERHVPGAWR